MTKIIQPPILETARLFLHPIRLDDAPSLQKHFNNWNVIKYLNDKVPWPYPDDGAYQFLKNDALPRMEAGKAMLWGIFPKENQQAAIGLVEFRAEKTGIVHAGVGKASFDAKKLAENIEAFIDTIQKARPSGAKGTFIRKITLSSTMGPGIKLDVDSIAKPVAKAA